MGRKHHTSRLALSRSRAIIKWKKGRKKAGFSEPSNEMVSIFACAFNMGYKIGRRHERNPKVQISPYKPVLDKLCRGEITFEEAAKTLNRTKEQIEKKLDDYEYVPTLEEEKEANKMMLESLKYIKTLFEG